jgi:ribonuclease BN (tRNA processing enzyme)
VVVLGSGTAIPTPRRGPTAHLLIDGEDVTLIDPGPGAVQRACVAGWPVETIRRVLLTHHHPDHCLDVVALLFARKNPVLAARCAPLEVIGGPGTRSLLERFRHVFGGWITLPPSELSVRDLGPGPFTLAFDEAGRPSIEGVAFEMNHSPASLGYRLTLSNGVSVAFSGDTAECDGAVEVARDVDHYVLEAALPDDQPVEGHLTPSRAARVAARARCRHLILTHFYPPVDVEAARRTALAEFSGRVTIAEDGLRVPLVSGVVEVA